MPLRSSLNPSRRGPRPFVVAAALHLLGFFAAASLFAQAPTASPTPAPPVGPIIVTAGVPDLADLNAYNAERTPQASVSVGAPPAPAANLSGTHGVAAVNAQDGDGDGSLHPVASGGAFPQITLSGAGAATPPATLASVTAAAKKQVKRAASTSTSSADASSSSPPPATVTLSYPADRAGTNVWVQALQGGTLSTVDEAGKTVSVPSGGFLLTIGAGGTITFTFQAPATPNTYQVLTRLDNVRSVLNFLVPDPEP